MITPSERGKPQRELSFRPLPTKNPRIFHGLKRAAKSTDTHVSHPAMQLCKKSIMRASCGRKSVDEMERSEFRRV